ncbi:MAG: M48 family metalloprotease, partial [Cyanobacteria bacterium J06641_5]
MDVFGDPSLDAAQAAIERGDYDEAIAHLERIRSEEIDESVISQAQQALVVAYSQSNRLDEAIDLCSWLAADVEANPWAPTTLTDLQERRERARLEAGESPVSAAVTAASTTPESRLPATIDGPDAGVYEDGRRWRQAGRAKRCKPLKPLARWRFWVLQVGTLAATFGLLRWCGLGLLDFANDCIVHRFSHPLPRYLSWHAEITWGAGLLLVVAIIGSPWWLAWILRRYYDARPMALTKLAARAPEAAKFLQRYCRQKKLSRPALHCVPLEHPVAIAYGGPIPGSARIVLSDGLLNRLQDAEMQTILASLLSQVVRRDCILMSALVGVLQLPYLAYWQLARWGDRRPKAWQKQPFAALAACCYGVYWLWRVPALWLSRRRLYYSDRFAAEVTGDPNALSRALLKIAQGTAAATATEQATHPLLE